MSIHRSTLLVDDPQEQDHTLVDFTSSQGINDSSPDPVNAVQRTVRSLLKISMNASEGDYIGSEGELQIRLNISRPTFRQAAKIVQNDRFIEIRRGVNGGIFAARPEMRDVVQRPALFLRLAGADLGDAQQVSRLLATHINRAAAQDAPPALRQRLLEFANECDLIVTAPVDERDTLAIERRFADQVTEGAGNAFFGLFLGIINEFGLWEHNLKIYHNRPDRCIAWITMIARQCRAIAAGNADLAEQLTKERIALVTDWIANHAQSTSTDEQA